MKDLYKALVELVALFDRVSIPYAVMRGMAVRAYAIPRATQDIDLTIAVDPVRRPQLYMELRNLSYDVPDIYETGWVD